MIKVSIIAALFITAGFAYEKEKIFPGVKDMPLPTGEVYVAPSKIIPVENSSGKIKYYVNCLSLPDKQEICTITKLPGKRLILRLSNEKGE